MNGYAPGGCLPRLFVAVNVIRCRPAANCFMTNSDGPRPTSPLRSEVQTSRWSSKISPSCGSYAAPVEHDPGLQAIGCIRLPGCQW